MQCSGIQCLYAACEWGGPIYIYMSDGTSHLVGCTGTLD